MRFHVRKAPYARDIAGGRFSRSLLGYRRAAVDEAVDELEAELGVRCEALRSRDAEIERFTAETHALGGRIVEQEREIGDLRLELADAHLLAGEEMRSLTVLGRQLEELRVGARGQATRIRLRALREAAELNARLVDATEGGEGDARERILDALEDAIDRVAGEWDVGMPTPPGALALTAIPVVSSGAVSSGVTPPARGNGGRRRVSVDVGPFADFSQLVRFEDAANAIGATGDISIKRFSEGRARIDVALSEPVDLLHELEERCDLEFKVRSSTDDSIVLDVDPS